MDVDAADATGTTVVSVSEDAAAAAATAVLLVAPDNANKTKKKSKRTPEEKAAYIAELKKKKNDAIEKKRQERESKQASASADAAAAAAAAASTSLVVRTDESEITFSVPMQTDPYSGTKRCAGDASLKERDEVSPAAVEAAKFLGLHLRQFNPFGTQRKESSSPDKPFDE